ncbi:MAG: hypothetical protein J6O40_02290 [Ruminococcus sp.]|nr:hypothetical protein [Ruminococcus sp.]
MVTPVMTVYVDILPSAGVSGDDYSVNMIRFHARAEGEYFNGETVMDGVDTQIFMNGKFTMSARYILEGTDFKGEKCKVFIENSGSTLSDLSPAIITDSKALSFLQQGKLSAVGESIGDGVIIRIFLTEDEAK